MSSLVALCTQGVRVEAQCFPPEPVAGFSAEPIGGEVIGSARLADEIIEICSLSRGYGRTLDSLFSLAQDSSDEFLLSVEVLDLEGPGQAGVEARAFRGTGSDPSQAVLRIAIEENAVGGFSVISSVRDRKSAAMVSAAAPVPVELPVRLGVERDGDRLATFFLEGAQRVEHLSVQLEAQSGLAVSTYRVAIVHGSDRTSPQRPQPGVARFREPILDRQMSVRPPRLSPLVEGFQGTVGSPAVLTIRGTGLASADRVTVAGLDTQILERSETRLVVEVPASNEPRRGDIVVHGSGGTAELPNAFFSFGRSFIRCDCNGDGEVDVSDMIRMIQHLFAGGPDCTCDESGDCNDDDDRDLSDPIRGLTFLFTNGEVPPSPPFPAPGTDPRAPMCGLEDQLPILDGISSSQISAGDEFFITGSGFSGSTRFVIPGARLEVLHVESSRVDLRADTVIVGGEKRVLAIADFARPLTIPCRPATCSSTALGPLAALEEPVELLPSGVGVVGASKPIANATKLEIQLDPDAFDPARPVEVDACILLPSIAGVTPGGRATSFQLPRPRDFNDLVVSLADRLRLELAAGGDLAELQVLPDRERGRIVICGTEALPAEFAVAGEISIHTGRVERCGPDETHPIFDEREHAWCRFTELVQPCNGLPRFESYVPLRFVKSKSSSLAGLPHPSALSPHDKEILFNWEAYCHVRRYRLWNLCTLERLVDLGRTDIPDFPVGAWVTKTIWRSDEELPPEIDRSKLYSYVYTGDGKTYYLTAIHHITKDIDEWFWYDAYPPVQILTGAKGEFVRGVGGCGGTNVDVPLGLADSIWANYFICTNVTRDQPIATSGVDGVGPTGTENSAWCGNFEFATECPDVIDAANLVPADDCFTGDDTCLRCHEDNSLASVGGATIGVDFLHSLKSAVPEPYPCNGDTGPVTYVSHVQPIINNNCSCHHWMEYSTLVNAPSGPVPSMDRIEPGDPMNSFLWRKVTNTHSVLCDPPESCGCAMPYDCSASPAPLASWELGVIEDWILGGAPYD